MSKDSSDSSSDQDSGENLSIYQAMVPKAEPETNPSLLKNLPMVSKHLPSPSISEHSLSNESQTEILKIGGRLKRKTKARNKKKEIASGVDLRSLESPLYVFEDKLMIICEEKSSDEQPAPKLSHQVISLAHIPETLTVKFPGYSVREIVHSKVDLRFTESTVDTVYFSSLLKSKNDLRLFSHLYETTLKIFLGYQLSQPDLELDEYSRLILNDILKRKFGKGLRQCDLMADYSQMLQPLTKLLKRDTAKRPEECYKFIYTRLLKHLKRKFREIHNHPQESSSTSSKMQLESEFDSFDELFHLHYFGQTAKEKGLNWTSFKYRAGAGKNGKEGVSILNNDYFGLVFSSGTFLLDSLSYLRESFISDYRKDVAKKLLALVGHWDRDFAILKTKRQAKYLEIKQYLSKNKHCKLPWTVGEAEKAVQRIFYLVDTMVDDELKELRITTLNSS